MNAIIPKWIAKWAEFAGPFVERDPFEYASGASVEAINQLEILAQVPLPPKYREYLMVFGGQPKSHVLERPLDMTVTRLLNFYAEQAPLDNPDVPAGGLIIARTPQESLWPSVALEYEWMYPFEPEEPRVVASERQYVTYIEAACFENWMYHNVFAAWAQLIRFGNTSSVSFSDQAVFSELVQFCEDSGMRRLSFSDQYQACLWSNDQPVVIQNALGSLTVFWNSCAKGVLESFKKKLLTHLPGWDSSQPK